LRKHDASFFLSSIRFPLAISRLLSTDASTDGGIDGRWSWIAMGRNVLRILLLLCCTLQAYVGQCKFASTISRMYRMYRMYDSLSSRRSACSCISRLHLRKLIKQRAKICAARPRGVLTTWTSLSHLSPFKVLRFSHFLSLFFSLVLEHCPLDHSQTRVYQYFRAIARKVLVHRIGKKLAKDSAVMLRRRRYVMVSRPELRSREARISTPSRTR